MSRRRQNLCVRLSRQVEIAKHKFLIVGIEKLRITEGV
jgi:hypothetical protein